MTDTAPLQVKSFEVPQANSLDRIRRLVEAVSRGATQKREIQAATGLSSRHADYYGQAARILGWLEREGETLALAPNAMALLRTPPGSDEERDVFAESIEACEVVQALCPDLLQEQGPSEDELTQRIRSATDLAQKTARRRAQALLAWRDRVVVSPSEPDQDIVSLLPDESTQGQGLATLHARFDSLSIERFKGIRQASVGFSALTLLAGPHGSGKSSFREAFRFLHGIGRNYSLSQIAGEHWGDTGTLAWPGIPGGLQELARLGHNTFSIEIGVAIPEGNQLRNANYFIEVTVEDAASPRVVRERLSLEDKGAYIFDSHPPQDAPILVPDRLSIRLGRTSRTGAKGPTLLVDPRRPALSQLAMHPAVRSRTVVDATSSVLSVFRSLRFLQPTLQAMQRPSFPHQVVLGSHGDHLSTCLHAICQDPERRDLVFRSLRSFSDGLLHDLQWLPDATGRLVLVILDRNGMKLTAPSISEGVLRFLTMLCAVVGFDNPSFWFVDNADMGFCPSKLSFVLDLLQRQCSGGHRQLVLTVRDENAVETLVSGKEYLSSAYRLFAHGWRSPERMGAREHTPPARPLRHPLRDEDDPNERLPF